MIDADIAGDAGAKRILALDAATRRHGGALRKKHCTYLAVLVGAAGAAQQGAVLFARAEILRGDKAAFPKAAAIVFGVGLVVAKPALAGDGGIDGQPTANQKLVQARGVIARGADADVPLIVGGVRAQVFAPDVAVADQGGQLVPRLGAARPTVGMVVDADLVRRRNVNSAEPMVTPPTSMAPPSRTTELAAKLWLAANIDRARTNQRIEIRPLSEDAIIDSYSRNKDRARPEAASAAQQQDGRFPAYKPFFGSVLLYDEL